MTTYLLRNKIAVETECDSNATIVRYRCTIHCTEGRNYSSAFNSDFCTEITMRVELSVAAPGARVSKRGL